MKTRTLIIMVLAFTLCNNASAQKIKTDKIGISYIELPSNPILDSSFRCYSAHVHWNGNKGSLSSDKFIIDGYKPVIGGSITVKVDIKNIDFGETELRKKVNETKDGEGKVISSTTLYYAYFPYSFDVDLVITDINGDEKNYNLSQSNFYNHDNFKESNSGLTRDFDANYRNKITTRIKKNYLESIPQKVNNITSKLYGYPSKRMGIEVYSITFKMPEETLYNESIKKTIEAFKTYNPIIDLQKIKDEVIPRIEILEGMIPSFSNYKTRQQKKLQYYTYLNIANMYLLLEMTDKAKQYAKEIALLDYRQSETDAAHLRRNSNIIEESLKVNHLNTRYLTIAPPINHKMLERNMFYSGQARWDTLNTELTINEINEESDAIVKSVLDILSMYMQFISNDAYTKNMLFVDGYRKNSDGIFDYKIYYDYGGFRLDKMGPYLYWDDKSYISSERISLYKIGLTEDYIVTDIQLKNLLQSHYAIFYDQNNKVDYFESQSTKRFEMIDNRQIGIREKYKFIYTANGLELDQYEIHDFYKNRMHSPEEKFISKVHYDIKELSNGVEYKITTHEGENKVLKTSRYYLEDGNDGKLNCFYAKDINGNITVYKYNQQDLLVYKKTIQQNKKEENYYRYCEDCDVLNYRRYDKENVAQHIEISYIDNIVQKKTIDNISFLQEHGDYDKRWEWKKGKYLFDGNSELYREYKENRWDYREKVNGIWSDWESPRM